MDNIPLTTDRTIARRITKITISYDKKSSSKIFQNGTYMGDNHKKERHLMIETLNHRSVYETTEELIVIPQGNYRVTTYLFKMTEQHWIKSQNNAHFKRTTYRGIRNIDTFPPATDEKEAMENLPSEDTSFEEPNDSIDEESEEESDSSDTNDDSLLNESSSEEDTDSELDGINGLLDGHFKETEANESEYLGFHNLAFEQEDGENAVLESELISISDDENDIAETLSQLDTYNEEIRSESLGDSLRSVCFEITDEEEKGNGKENDENAVLDSELISMSDDEDDMAEALREIDDYNEERQNECEGLKYGSLEVAGEEENASKTNKYIVADHDAGTKESFGEETERTQQGKDEAADEGNWKTVKKSLKIAAGCAGVALAMYAAYKYFRS